MYILRLLTNLILSISFFSFENLNYPNEKLKNFAEGLNIEGGIPAKSLNKDQIWANLCIVLDRPLEDGIDLFEITDNNTFPLKESVIESYNEAQVNLSYLLVLRYYITEAHKLSKKNSNELTKLVIQVHRNGSGLAHLQLLDKLMKLGLADLQGKRVVPESKEKNSVSTYLFSKYHVLVEFRYGYSHETISNFEGQDIVLSISLASGLASDLPSGSLLIPDHFIPFNLKTMEISLLNSYKVQNHLLEALPSIIKKQKLSDLALINEKFLSSNSKKNNQIARLLYKEDFHRATLLQADGLFNPKLLSKSFVVKLK